MIKQYLDLQSTIMAVSCIHSVHADVRLDDEQWASLKAVETFLRLPAQVSTIVCSSKTCSISLAHGANNEMIKHCNDDIEKR